MDSAKNAAEAKVKPFFCEFEIPLEPFPQPRPRVTVRQGHAWAYKSRTQKANEAAIDEVLRQYKPEKPMEGPVSVWITACLAIPASLSKRRRDAMSGTWHTGRKDVDNIAKILLDRLTAGGWWVDDRQVARLFVEKIYYPQPHWLVRVRELTA